MRLFDAPNNGRLVPGNNFGRHTKSTQTRVGAEVKSRRDILKQAAAITSAAVLLPEFVARHASASVGSSYSRQIHTMPSQTLPPFRPGTAPSVTRENTWLDLARHNCFGGRDNDSQLPQDIERKAARNSIDPGAIERTEAFDQLEGASPTSSRNSNARDKPSEYKLFQDLSAILFEFVKDSDPFIKMLSGDYKKSQKIAVFARDLKAYFGHNDPDDEEPYSNDEPDAALTYLMKEYKQKEEGAKMELDQDREFMLREKSIEYYEMAKERANEITKIQLKEATPETSPKRERSDAPDREHDYIGRKSYNN